MSHSETVEFKVGDRVRLVGPGWRTPADEERAIPMEGDVVTLTEVSARGVATFVHPGDPHVWAWFVWPREDDQFGGVIVNEEEQE